MRAGTLIVNNTTGSGQYGSRKVANATFGGSGIVAGPVTMENGGPHPIQRSEFKTTLPSSLLTLRSTTYTYL